MLFFAEEDFTFFGETLILVFSGVLLEGFALFFSVLEEIFFEGLGESFVEFLMLLTLGFVYFEEDFAEFLDKACLDSTFVLFFAEPCLLDLVDSTLTLVLLVVTFADFEEDLVIVVFLDAYNVCCFKVVFALGCILSFVNFELYLELSLETFFDELALTLPLVVKFLEASFF